MQTVVIDISKDVLTSALDEINSLIITGNAHIGADSNNSVLRKKIDALQVAKKVMLEKLDFKYV